MNQGNQYQLKVHMNEIVDYRFINSCIKKNHEQIIFFRTRQTEEEVLRLEKIKKELQVLDGQFSQDVAVLRKKIDQACFSYSEAE